MNAMPSARLLLFAALGAGAMWAPAPAPQPVFSVDVLVTDAQDRPVPGLTREDFEILAGGDAREVQSVAVGRTPLDIILLMDLTASLSATLQRRDLEEDVERALIDALQDGERLRVGGFARRVILTNPLTPDRRRLRTELRTAMSHRREELYGPSPIWDATWQAIESFPETDARRAVILITDGRATGNVHGVEDLALAAMLRGAAIHIVGQDLEVHITQSAVSAVAVRPGNVLGWLSDVTGGRFISATALGERPAGPLTDILASLRQTYTLTFAAPALDGAPHELEVRVKRPDVKVRARSMYGGRASEPGKS